MEPTSICPEECLGQNLTVAATPQRTQNPDWLCDVRRVPLQDIPTFSLKIHVKDSFPFLDFYHVAPSE